MKRYFVLIFLTVIGTSFGQDSKLRVEVSYPAIVGGSIGENYTGVIDFGVTYKIKDFDKFLIGGSVNSSFLKNSKDGFVLPSSKLRAFTLQPKVYITLGEAWKGLVKPFVGAGYAFIFFDFDPGTVPEGNIDLVPISPSTDDTISGFNINAGFSIDIIAGFFVQAQYDFIPYKSKSDSSDLTFNRNLTLGKVGLGYTF